jgi:hypothetical protein
MDPVLWLPNCGGDSGVAGYGGFGGLVHSWWSTRFGGGGFAGGGVFATGFGLLHGVAQGPSCGGGVEMHSGGVSASMAVLLAGGGSLHMTAGSCRFEMLRLCAGLGFCYGLWAFIFYVYVLMDEGPAASSE